MFLSCVEGNNGLQHTHGTISLWLRTLHRPKCMEKKSKFVSGLGGKGTVWTCREAKW